jgi:hypothetical protein
MSTFPATPAVGVLKVAFGADPATDPAGWTWTDITQYWEAAEPVTVSDGRSEGAVQAESLNAALTLNASDGALMPDDPRSPYWPHVDIGTPVWMTINAGSGVYDLIQGFISGLTPAWPGRSGHLCWVRVAITGTLARLGVGQSPLRLPLERAIRGDLALAHWPLDDPENSTQGASAASGAPAMGVIADPKWAQIDGPPGAPGKYVLIREGDASLCNLYAQVPAAAAGEWAVEGWVYYTATAHTGSYANCSVFSWMTSGSYARWEIRVDESDAATPTCSISVHFETPDAVYRFNSVGSSTPRSGTWQHFRVTCHTSGSSTVVNWYVNGVAATPHTIASTTAGRVLAVSSPIVLSWTESYAVQTVALAHLAVYDSVATDHYPAGLGWAGETASARISRLCAEEGVRVTVTAGSSEPMGTQTSAKFLDLLRECEATDQGRLGETNFGLSYRPRSSLYAQVPALALDGSKGEIGDPFSPALDRQRLRNEFKISRKGGSSATWADITNQALRGRLDDSAEINTSTDEVLVHHAQWRTGYGVQVGMRYPALGLDLGRHPTLITAWMGLRLGDRVQGTQPVRQHPTDTIDQLVEGRSQTLRGLTRWTVTMVTSPARPYDVMIVQGAGNAGRLDTSASTLATLAPAAAVGDTTVLSVTTSTGPLLSLKATYPADFPVVCDLGGEMVTVTNCTGGTSPQTVTVTRGGRGWTKAHPVGTPLKLWRAGQIAL